MSSIPPETSAEIDDLSCPDTPVAAPSATQIPTIEAPELVSTAEQPAEPSLASTLKLPETQYLSPTPLPKPSFCLEDVLDPSVFENLETLLGPEVGAADITVAADGSFIETSSGPVARELKRRYDQLLGVGSSARSQYAISPYAITGFLNQHGRPMYRIGHRDEKQAPAASGAEVEERIIQASDPTHSPPRTKRRSRLSMHFPQAMFTKPPPPPARPPTVTSTSSRKLRKTRSIPDMFGAGPIVTNAPTFSVTGRAHSQSVTAADLPRPSMPFNAPRPDRQIDFFGDLMDWFTPPSSGSSNFSSHSLFNPGKVSSDPARPRTAIAQPFGNGILFNVPSQQPVLDRLPMPRHLREMQSFDSSVTARQVGPSDNTSDEATIAEDSVRPASIRLSLLSDADESEHDSQSSDEERTDAGHPQLDITPSLDSLRLSSHYSTEVFNVLQTYRGLPLFENLASESGESATVIKLSLSADQNATPRDDPRFVIWGDMISERETEDHSTSKDSLTDMSSPTNVSSSSISRRRSSKVSKIRSPEPTSSTLPDVPPQRVLIAATIERWIAQLTSDLNYDELLNFFLTYRTYVSAVDLCHLLICRFHWALQAPSSLQDGTVRRIVRVRTFVAIRYWLLTFFTVDFIPNRELRLLITDWLNTLIGDPILTKHSDATDIVRRLIKVAKECKRAHIRTNERPKADDETPVRTDAETLDPADQSVEHLLGKSFAEATRKVKPPTRDDVSELDLDFLPDDAKTDDAPLGFPNDPANAHLTASSALGGVLSGNRPTSLPLSSLSILQRTDHAPGPPDADLQYMHNGTVQLSMKHSALSRAFVRTIGRLGRWKRALAPRTASRPPSIGSCAVNVSAFDLEVSAAQDLLTRPGDVERYRKMTESRRQAKLAPPPALVLTGAPALPQLPAIPPLPTTPPPLPTPNDVYSTPQSPLPVLRFQDAVATPAPAAEAVTPSEASIPSETLGEASSEPAAEMPVADADSVVASAETPSFTDDTSSNVQSSISEEFSAALQLDHLHEPSRAYSFRSSSSTDSFGEPLTSDGPLPPTFPGKYNQWQFDVVSIDDLDLSDTSSLPPDVEDPSHPPGLRRPPRKLPTRRDFEFVRRSMVSSMGIVSQEAMRDSVASSAQSEVSPTGSGPQPLHKWQLKSLQQTFEAMSNDGEDNGDVEAALRRLEGHINPKTQQERAEKVDGWVRTLQERMASGEHDYESSVLSEDDVEPFFDEADSAESDATNESNIELEVSGGDADAAGLEDAADTPMPTQTAHQMPAPPGLHSKPAVEDAVPLEILQSRVPPAPDGATPAPASIVTKFVGADVSRYHQSFILGNSTEALARCFAMIDRELFMGVKFEELVSEDWVECEEINVLDWAQYLKDRARWKAEGRFAVKTTALAALRARFNLMVSFVISEIVLSTPSDRLPVVNKLCRLAWKSYTISNFHTVTAIITALQNGWVTKAMGKQLENRLSGIEARMYKDLKCLIANVDDFKYMRTIVDSIVDAKPLDSNNNAASIVSGGDSLSGKGKAAADNRPIIPSACIPFIGVYLSQLYKHNKLPALIDPTAPNSVIGIHAETAIFDPPAHPEVFADLAPLPPSMHLEPLINVHKQRRIADVIKSLVAGQHLASRIHFNIDKRLFQRCLKLRGLDAMTLQRALDIYRE
ncbi:hypothetical protein HYPSUDRAFT_65218 [Hypholoma sublateritium FD-334 SS-4]|uniref:Ras GEF n=1 Tax=Hypholoma sublateritium (strain FD-334 SS-4) TaxID=945553 RepID=A0A0D2PZZ9_HYPSF|nr:hypothetical protein HYPSUDRAFT_65218 [Hypholoma sublateritium FD-334 SS-4]